DETPAKPLPRTPTLPRKRRWMLVQMALSFHANIPRCNWPIWPPREKPFANRCTDKRQKDDLRVLHSFILRCSCHLHGFSQTRRLSQASDAQTGRRAQRQEIIRR